MSLSIRHWLAERQIELDQLGNTDAQLAGVAFRIAQDMEVKSLTAFDISILVEILELPLPGAWQLVKPISRLCVWLLHVISRKKPLKRNEGTWLTFQIAYLNALQGILEQELQLRRPWLNRASFTIGLEKYQFNLEVQSPLHSVPLNEPQLQALLKTLRPGRLSDSQAEQALSKVGESLLVQQMNSTSSAWFVANGAEETEAKLLVQRLVYGLPGYLLSTIAENALPLAQLQKFVRLGNPANWRDSSLVEATEQNSSGLNEEQFNNNLTQNFALNLAQEHYRATLIQSLSEPILAEIFALKDLYISLKGVEERAPQEELTSNSGVDLIDWAIAQLQDKTTIAVIEADPGYGKTSLCQMLAAKVAQELYPQWMPILIDLRHASLGHTLEETLASAFPQGCFKSANSWLSPLHPPCLLLLDGLDELPRSSWTKRHIITFIEQLVQFQKQQAEFPQGLRHKIILTSRPEAGEWLVGAVKAPYSLLPTPYSQLSMLRRIKIQPLQQDEFREWFVKWAKLQSKSIAQEYFSFLKQGGVFRFKEHTNTAAVLFQQPLMLYFLGVLYRDGLLNHNIFQANATNAKLEIGDRLVRWLLGEPLPGNAARLNLVKEGFAHAYRSPEAIANLVTGTTPQQMRRSMQTTALNILQGKQSEQSGEKELGLNLPALFFRLCPMPYAPYPTTKIEFSHSNLGAYLCAEEIAIQLKFLTQKVPDQYGEFNFVIDSELKVAQHIYQLLGYGLLSTEIEELLIGRLRREATDNSSAFSFSILFNRLYLFYRSYCQGRWLDRGTVHELYSQMQLNAPLSTLQIDAAVGINVFVLLCAIARFAQIPFWPCGNPDKPQEFNPEQLLTFISRTTVLSPTAFWQRSRYILSQIQLAEACLNYAMLAEANLWQANLMAAELIGANLTEANLQAANLSRANLSGASLKNANLSGAKLQGADLSGANLLGANLTLANLTNACLFQAQLDEETKRYAYTEGAIFSIEEFHRYNQSLDTTQATNNDSDYVADGETTLLLIQSPEGEPVIPEGYEEESAETAVINLVEYHNIEANQLDNDEYAETVRINNSNL